MILIFLLYYFEQSITFIHIGRVLSSSWYNKVCPKIWQKMLIVPKYEKHFYPRMNKNLLNEQKYFCFGFLIYLVFIWFIPMQKFVQFSDNEFFAFCFGEKKNRIILRHPLIVRLQVYNFNVFPGLNVLSFLLNTCMYWVCWKVHFLGICHLVHAVHTVLSP